MLLRVWSFGTLILVALLTGLTFAHVLELPAKMEFDADLYVRLQQSLYWAWGPLQISGFLEPAAIFATAVLAWMARRQKRTVRLAVAATVSLLIAFRVIFFLAVNPANREFAAMTPGSVPSSWSALRTQWEFGHAARFVFHMYALGALAAVLPGVQRLRATVSP